MPKAFISTVPFGSKDPRPLEMLRDAGIEAVLNPLGRRPTEPELCDLVRDADVFIAGTEQITDRVMASAPALRIISRVGIGLDNVDLAAARRRGIVVCYTPDAPAPAVAELTVGLMLSLLRFIHTANTRVRTDGWHRFMGRRLGETTVGLIGVGRVGRRVVRHLAGFQPAILANDLQPSRDLPGIEWVEKDEIYARADVISIHVPLTPSTDDMIAMAQIERMKPDALLINTSRGGIVRESDLATALRAGRLAGAAVDVFRQEPYHGELLGIERCLMTCHMGSMSEDCRRQMETEAVENVVQFLRGTPTQVVPESEYQMHEARMP
jgi:D-3-phosphoglycerate dehydrogenase / 2-oxoglutarate reductase